MTIAHIIVETYHTSNYNCKIKKKQNTQTLYKHVQIATMITSGSAMAEGPRDALVSRNSATTKYPYRMALFA